MRQARVLYSRRSFCAESSQEDSVRLPLFRSAPQPSHQQISLPKCFSPNPLVTMNILHLVYKQSQSEGGIVEKGKAKQEPGGKRKSKGTGVEERRSK